MSRLTRVSLGAIALGGLGIFASCGGSDSAGLFGGGGGFAAQGGVFDAATGGLGGGTGGTATGGSAGTAGSETGGTAGASTGGAAGSGGTTATGGTAGAATGGAAGSGGGNTGGTPGYTLSNVCNKLPQELCKSRADCCNQTFGYDEKNCLALEDANCQAGVQAVKTGDRVFHPERIDPCLTQLAPLMKQCVYTGAQLALALKTINQCLGIFDPKLPVGSACTETMQCQTSPSALGWVDCDDQSQKCEQGIVRQLGESCNDSALCEDGLWCTQSQGGTCQPAVQVGGFCTSSLQCGYGYLCAGGGGGGTCQPAGGAGANCSYYHHCQTLVCYQGKCTEPRPYVEKADCGK